MGKEDKETREIRKKSEKQDEHARRGSLTLMQQYQMNKKEIERQKSMQPQVEMIKEEGDGAGDGENNVVIAMKVPDIAPNQNKAQDGGEQEDGAARGSWGGKIEFILTCIGFAVGLGNVWRFPYLCFKHGGGAFLLPYVIMLLVVGLPLFFMEFAFGQFASLGPIAVWNISPLFKGVGFSMIICSFFTSLYYNVIISQCMFYLASSFTSVLPWSTCNNTWNTPNCIETFSDSANGTSMTLKMPLNGTATSPAEEYYYNFVLQQSDGMDSMGLPSWRLTLCLLIGWTIVIAALIKGVSSLGKVAYFTAIFPYIILTILLVRACTLTGAYKGIRFYTTPVFSKLANPRVWTDAATQIFYSLSCCTGGLITMSSYNKFKNNCCRDAVIVAFLNCATSVYAGFVIFANLGFMAHKKNTTIEGVAQSGPGLAFIVYPEALTQMPLSPLWSVLFFFMMLTLGFGSQFSMVETVLSGIQDELRSRGWIRRAWHAISFRVCLCVVSFLLGLPMVCRGGIYMLTLLDWSVSGFPMLIIGLLELVVISHLYGLNQFTKDVQMMTGERPNLYWKTMWKFVSPGVILALLLFFIISSPPPKYGSYVYPPRWHSFGNLIAVSTIIAIPLAFLYKYCREGGWIILKEYLKPEFEWGPANLDNRADFIQGMDNHQHFVQSKQHLVEKLSRAASKEQMRRSTSQLNLAAATGGEGAEAAAAGDKTDEHEDGQFIGGGAGNSLMVPGM